MTKINIDLIKMLFSSNYKYTTEKEQKKLDEIFETIMNNNSWVDIYKSLDYYLRNECKTEDDIINFVNLFGHYIGHDFEIPYGYNPYDLIGYILSRVDLEKRWDDCDFFDDFANQALKIDLYKDPYYQFWRDPKIIEIANKYKKKEIDLSKLSKVNHELFDKNSKWKKNNENNKRNN